MTTASDPEGAPADHDTRQGIFLGPGSVVNGTLIGVNYGVVTITSAVAALHQIRAPLEDFVGREAEIGLLREALRPRDGAAPVAAITGMGGLGKTELALKVAALIRADYPDAQLFISLRGASTEGPRDPADALRGAIRAFDPNTALPNDLDGLVALYRGHIGGRRALVLVDDAPDSATARLFLPPPGCALIATSRNRLWFKGQGAMIALGLFNREEARALLRNDAPHLHDHPLAERLLERCGDLPLAVRVAAAALADESLAPERYLARLEDEARRLKALQFDDVDVYAVLSVSDDLLLRAAPALARRWRMLGVCPAPFDALAVRAIWDERDEDALADGLRQLAQRALVRHDPERGLYAVHDLLRDIAAARRSREDDAAARLRHAEHYLAIFREAQRRYAQGHEAAAEGLRLFDSAAAHIKAAGRWAATAGTPEADRLCIYEPGDVSVLDVRLVPGELAAWGAAAADAARRRGDDASAATALVGAGGGSLLAGEVAQAVAHYEAGLAIFRAIGDRRGEARALLGRGEALQQTGRYPEAEADYRAALDLAEQHADHYARARARRDLGHLFAYTRSYDQARSWLEQARDDFVRLGDDQGLSRTLDLLSLAYEKQNDAEAALACAAEQLRIATRHGDQVAVCAALNRLGLAHWVAGRIDQALEHLQRQLAVATAIDYPQGIAFANSDLAGVRWAQGDHAGALGHLAEVVTIARAIGDRTSVGVAVSNAGLILAQRGQDDDALRCYAEALRILVDLGEWTESPVLIGNIAEVYQRQGRDADALDLFEQALALMERFDAPQNQPWMRYRRAELLLMLGRPADALAQIEVALDAPAEGGEDETSTRVRLLQIAARLALGALDAPGAVAAIESLAADAAGDEARALGHEALWRADPRREADRWAAAELYRRLAEAGASADHRSRYEELSGERLPPPPRLPPPEGLAPVDREALDALVARVVAHTHGGGGDAPPDG